MQFVILAKDARDPDTPSRRRKARAEHLDRALLDHKSGDLLFGGALLDDEGAMTGSILLVDLPDEAAVREWIANDPYTRNHVWESVEILPFRLAVP